VPAADYKDNDLDGHERFDRIMFFADGDFQPYRANPMVRGNVARICYLLAKQGGIRAEAQNPAGRVLARTQHILLTADPADFLDPNSLDDQQWFDWNNRDEYDKVSLQYWKTGFSPPQKADMLSVITDIRFSPGVADSRLIGATVEPADPNSIHMLLCEGVGELKIQGWHDAQRRWVPEVDPDGNGNLADTDFILDPSGGGLHPASVPGVLYPYPRDGMVLLGGVFANNPYLGLLNEEHFYEIPGLGRALKFTFTLYDSKGIIKEGRTFTHIVYLN
jgi:hypothetical protein